MKKLTVKLIGFVRDSSDTIWRIGDEVYRVTSKAGELDSNGLPAARRWEASYNLFKVYASKGVFPHIQLLDLE